MGAQQFNQIDGSWVSGSPTFQISFLSGYPISIFIAIFVSFLTSAYFWKRQKYSWESLQIILIIVIPSSILGAKFYTMLVENNWNNPFRLEGLSIYGALIFSISSGLITVYFMRKSIDMRTAISIILPTILIGQAIGRWGNFANHEVYGKIVSGDSLNWMGALKSHMFIDNAYRAPLFLYESLISTLGYLFIVWILNEKNRLKPGTTAGIYVLWYSIERLILQTFRDSSPMNTSYFPETKTSVNLVFSIIFIFLGIIMIIWFQFLSKPFIKFKIVKLFETEIFEITSKFFHKFLNIFRKIKKPYEKKEFKLKIFQLKYTQNIEYKKLNRFKKEYELIKPTKKVRRFFIGSYYERTFNIWLPNDKNKSQWSKKEINRGKKFKTKK